LRCFRRVPRARTQLHTVQRNVNIITSLHDNIALNVTLLSCLKNAFMNSGSWECCSCTTHTDVRSSCRIHTLTLYIGEQVTFRTKMKSTGGSNRQSTTSTPCAVQQGHEFIYNVYSHSPCARQTVVSACCSKNSSLTNIVICAN
jgi:hypothetical protein